MNKYLLNFRNLSMFTGIIESIGVIKHIQSFGTNRTFTIESPISHELKPDQSVSHNGVCLTVESVDGNQHRVTAIEETLNKTSLSHWAVEQKINLERCLSFQGRLDGHIVQGHVDGVGSCVSVKEIDGSWQYQIAFPEAFAPLLIEKGSVCVNGISLTAFNVGNNIFEVAIIPYTFYHTTMQSLQPGNPVNLEFDVIGKYLQRHLQLLKH